MAIAQIYTGRPNDILPAITQLDASEHEPGNLEDVGLDFLTTSARLGDSASMAYLAEAFDTGHNLGSDREQSYSQVALVKKERQFVLAFVPTCRNLALCCQK